MRAMRALAQGVFDAFCRDMDHNLREMGISDQGVPRQMRRVGEAFYGRAQAYDAALAAGGDGRSSEALARNVYAGAAERRRCGTARRLCARRRSTISTARSLPDSARGDVRFPEPATLAAAAE